MKQRTSNEANSSNNITINSQNNTSLNVQSYSLAAMITRPRGYSQTQQRKNDRNSIDLLESSQIQSGANSNNSSSNHNIKGLIVNASATPQLTQSDYKTDNFLQTHSLMTIIRKPKKRVRRMDSFDFPKELSLDLTLRLQHKTSSDKPYYHHENMILNRENIQSPPLYPIKQTSLTQQQCIQQACPNFYSNNRVLKQFSKNGEIYVRKQYSSEIEIWNSELTLPQKKDSSLTHKQSCQHNNSSQKKQFKQQSQKLLKQLISINGPGSIEKFPERSHSVNIDKETSFSSQNASIFGLKEKQLAIQDSVVKKKRVIYSRISCKSTMNNQVSNMENYGASTSTSRHSQSVTEPDDFEKNTDSIISNHDNQENSSGQRKQHLLMNPKQELKELIPRSTARVRTSVWRQFDIDSESYNSNENQFHSSDFSYKSPNTKIEERRSKYNFCKEDCRSILRRGKIESGNKIENDTEPFAFQLVHLNDIQVSGSPGKLIPFFSKKMKLPHFTNSSTLSEKISRNLSPFMQQ